ncbi:thioredoxin family protein [Massilia sp. CF038]|uniref:thioredoxin family protein n=1 Tax=Massilia sp. CF038 TaxID=1881045 RepID=UPI00091C1CB9|nr:thioredoxin family protein [Massilia sp. CF038]SHH67553.1 Thioredoxin-like [Massilia sp. CF038]
MSVNWHQGGADAAFSAAAARGLPLFLYWGAGWCPPCNRIRASVFERPDFIALNDAMVALHIDGDSPGAQRLAARFQVRSYPTLIVYQPDGAEITRLPCEVDGARFVELLRLSLESRVRAADALDAALSAQQDVTDAAWQLLGFYAWDTDENQLLRGRDLPSTLASLALACPVPEAALRLQWHALHAAATAGKGGLDQRAAVKRLEETLIDARTVRAQMDMVSHHAIDFIRHLTVPQSATRLHLIACWSNALAQLETDPSLTMADQLAALRTRVRIARLGVPMADMERVVRARVAQAVLAVSAPAMRHQIINTAAGMLSDAGLLDEAEQLLRAELVRSHAPYYFMHNLATIAKKRGDAASAVAWYEQAWDSAQGAATRLQWGATYLQALIDFAPHEVPRIDRFASRMLEELGTMGDAACQRNRSQLDRIDSKLALWHGASAPAAALRAAVGNAVTN